MPRKLSIYVCEVCGSEFQSRSYPSPRSCKNKKCKHIIKSQSASERDYSNRWLIKTCLTCGKEFETRISIDANYCSNDCNLRSKERKENLSKKYKGKTLEERGWNEKAIEKDKQIKIERNLEMKGKSYEELYPNKEKREEYRDKLREASSGKNNPMSFQNRKEFYKNKIQKRLENNNLQLLDYEIITRKNDKNTYYKIKCLNCNNEFYSYLACGNIPLCNKCAPSCSKMQNEIFNLFNDLKEKVFSNKRDILNGKELDVFIPSHNLAIEFNGLYWHSEKQGKNKNYHLNKTKKCQEQGIKLVHMFEDEWINKKEIVKSILKSKLGIYKEKIGARKCIVKEINNKIAFDFLENNHIQGGINSKYNYGLFFENELISIISISKSRFKKDCLEITRFANKLNYSIIGGFSKLFSFFKKNNNFNRLKTYADIRYFDGKVYEKNGFVFSHCSNPNYYYLDKNYNKRYNRIKFQKHKLKNLLENFNSSLTEWENMLNNGYDRIWNCGNKVYVYEDNK
jgi:hypothetical protein